MLEQFQALQLDLYFNQGTSYTKNFTLLDATPDYPQPIDLTGVTLVGAIKRYTGVGLEPVSPICVVTEEPGTFNMSMLSSDTKLLVYPRYVYEIIAVDNISPTKIVKIMFGQLHIQTF